MDSKLNPELEFYHTVHKLFTKFHKSEKGETDCLQLIAGLKRVENALKHLFKGRGHKGKTLWMRFYTGDTLATDINDVERLIDIRRTGKTNYNFILECIEVMIKPNSGFELHFS